MARKKRSDPPSAFTLMWLMVMFDLPVGSKKEIRRANQFRSGLQQLGFERKQFSVYLRPCRTLDHAKTQARKVKLMVPAMGEVTVFYITDRQYMLAENYFGKDKVDNEEQVRRKEQQLKLF